MPKEKEQVTGKLVFCERREAKNGGKYFRCGIKLPDRDKPVFWNASEKPGEVGEEVTVNIPVDVLHPEGAGKASRGGGNGSRYTEEDTDRMNRAVALKAAAEAATALHFGPKEAPTLSNAVMRMAQTFYDWLQGNCEPKPFGEE